MTKDEALKLALEALDGLSEPYDVLKAQEAIREALAQPEQEPVAYSYTSRITGAQGFSHHPMPRFIDSESWDIKSLYTQQYTYIAPTHQKPFGWKLVPIEPTNEMLKAMDECSTEGYDERLLAGHASSVYMAAVDVAPTPPQPEQNEFNPDWDAMAVMVEEQQRMAKRIAELEAKPEQEPVAWMYTSQWKGDERLITRYQSELMTYKADKVWPLYTTPPHRNPLSDEEIKHAWYEACKTDVELTAQLVVCFARAIEAAHGIKGPTS